MSDVRGFFSHAWLVAGLRSAVITTQTGTETGEEANQVHEVDE